ncbi:MAG: DegT/DnrJ/EryC1/StrS family aminotransferase [Elusimicrobia bacterium]|nr:DegT/DnrJ/EryC1/StrS family aminotransferase [Elusimicrobiota bacterium]
MAPTKSVEKTFVPFWKTTLGDAEARSAGQAILEGRLSMGKVTEELERRLAELLGVPYVVCTTSGSAALYLGAAAAGLGPGTEALLPNRTFMATAHAVLLAGGSVRLVDTRADCTLIDEDAIEARITKKTKAVIVVHLNGNSVDMVKVRKIADKHGLMVIEDAAQAFYSKDKNGFLGTQSDIGCFSLGVTKLITCGQGGCVVTRKKEIYERLLLLRGHGVKDTFEAKYERFGFNFKFNDIAAAVALVQLGKLEAKKKAHLALHHYYCAALKGLDHVEVLPVKESLGNLPLWVEALVDDRANVIKLLAEEKIQSRPYLPNLSDSAYLGEQGARFPNSERFAQRGLFLPSGPDLPMEAAERTVAALKAMGPKLARGVR